MRSMACLTSQPALSHKNQSVGRSFQAKQRKEKQASDLDLIGSPDRRRRPGIKLASHDTTRPGKKKSVSWRGEQVSQLETFLWFPRLCTRQ